MNTYFSFKFIVMVTFKQIYIETAKGHHKNPEAKKFRECNIRSKGFFD
jgi:hypothetical protein